MAFLIAQDNEDAAVLRVDYAGRYIQNHTDDWQWIFNNQSELTPKILLQKNAGQFDTSDYDSIKLISYLYNPRDASIAAGSTCTFKVYRISVSSWTETLINIFNGTILPNSYFYVDVPVSSLTPADLDGDNTIMVECTIIRLNKTYRDRIYLNHLGSYASIVKLRQDVEFLDVTKLDE